MLVTPSTSSLSQSQDAVPDDQFSPEEVAFFQEQGYAVVRGLADESMRTEMLRATLDGLGREIGPLEYEADVQYPGSPSSRNAKGGRTIRRLQQAVSRDPVFLYWASHPGVVGRMRQLLGPKLLVPLAHHNCVMTKQPAFSSDTGWHQDVRYWSFTRPELVSVWLALGVENEENGCLQVIPGTHRTVWERHRFDDALFLRPDLPENAELIARRIAVRLAPGDALFFHGRTFHSASRNFTNDPKFSVVLTYRPADNPPISGTRSGNWPELQLPS